MIIPQNVIDYENARWWEAVHFVYFLICALPVLAIVGGLVWLMQRSQDEDEN